MPVYSYAVAKYIPDMVKNEPVNVGVLVQTKEMTRAKFIKDFSLFTSRYKDINVDALQVLLNSFSGSYKIDPDYPLSHLHKHFQSQLQFSEPAAIRADSPNQALDEIYDSVISIEPPKRNSRHFTKARLLSALRKQIKLSLNKNWVMPKYVVNGPIDSFKFDYAFKNGRISDLLHVISFDSDSKRALTHAKALALTVKYVNDSENGIVCSVLLHAPNDEKERKDYYQPAVSYLKDQNCIVKTQDQIPQYVNSIRKKLTSHA